MGRLSVLSSRVNTVKGVLEQWAAFDAHRATEVAAALAKHPRARRVAFVDEVQPHYGNLLASYIAQVIGEHRQAAKHGIGDAGQHASAIAAWQMTARSAQADAGYETVARLVDIAAELSMATVTGARQRR